MAKVNKTICVFSPKGGVGKTILSLNLAGVASSMGLKTLLVDFDVHNGSLSVVIDEDISKTIYHLTSDLQNNRYKRLADYTYKYNEFIDILPAPRDPRQGNKIPSSYIDLIFDKISRNYDLVIIDTESAMNEMNVITLDKVDEILFVVDNDIMTLKNTRSILNIFSDIEKDNFKVLLNESIDFKNPYFSNQEIRRIIGANIDYYLSKGSYIKDITNVLYKNKIPSLIGAYSKKCKKDYNTLGLIINDLWKGDNDEEE